MILYRPTGQKELDLVSASGFKRWPPRLIDQPIFYPVTTFSYAEKIARDWNSILPAPNNFGYVLRFEINRETADRYSVQQAGGRDHEELWVPADELERFNDGILGVMEVVAIYRDGQRVE
ncbi:ADP-ribosylation/crystallin J1 [Neogemmobacter tilapiae]|uniref:ADP-ribosylation/crystallin J1 n=1 Tax=Neogemmobacter tilapiae TaxID=875041 RepID=A0A918TQS7_9RHOB|nr:ADP-ribosylation/crystallin J1 [Gemmobacter tilapiae]GHC57819.1 hypothetical protein GCM10007315_21670 [Gemmobacter tilapiae]